MSQQGGGSCPLNLRCGTLTVPASSEQNELLASITNLIRERMPQVESPKLNDNTLLCHCGSKVSMVGILGHYYTCRQRLFEDTMTTTCEIILFWEMQACTVRTRCSGLKWMEYICVSSMGWNKCKTIQTIGLSQFNGLKT